MWGPHGAGSCSAPTKPFSANLEPGRPFPISSLPDNRAQRTAAATGELPQHFSGSRPLAVWLLEARADWKSSPADLAPQGRGPHDRASNLGSRGRRFIVIGRMAVRWPSVVCRLDTVTVPTAMRARTSPVSAGAHGRLSGRDGGPARGSCSRACRLRRLLAVLAARTACSRQRGPYFVDLRLQGRRPRSQFDACLRERGTRRSTRRSRG